MRAGHLPVLVVVLLATLPAMLPAPAAEPANLVLAGTVVKVKDGDSLVVRLVGGPAGTRRNDIEVRLHGADAPEYRQAGGRAARDYLRRRVAGRAVEIRPVVQDSYGRLVGVVFVAGTDINAALVGSGHAWAYRQYLGEVEGADDFCRLEADARAARRGLWSAPPESWVPPWVYRRAARGSDSTPAPSFATETDAGCRRAIPRARPAPRR